MGSEVKGGAESDLANELATGLACSGKWCSGIGPFVCPVGDGPGPAAGVLASGGLAVLGTRGGVGAVGGEAEGEDAVMPAGHNSDCSCISSSSSKGQVVR